MSPAILYMVSGLAVFGVCLYGVIVHAHLIRKILALNILSTGVFVVLAAISRRGSEVDPVPHAMVLTGIVVAVSATAFALALLRRLHEESGSAYLSEEGFGEGDQDERGSG